jgi:hypothetical protein
MVGITLRVMGMHHAERDVYGYGIASSGPYLSGSTREAEKL